MSSFVSQTRIRLILLAFIFWWVNSGFSADAPGIPLNARLDSRLVPAVKALTDGAASNESLSAGVRATFEKSIVPSFTGWLVLQLDVPNVNELTLKKIAATGAEVLDSSARWNAVTVRATLAEVAALVELPGVQLIKLARRARARQQGRAANQGDAAMKADLARLANGLTGAGQKIGVLSDSFNDTVAVGAGKKSGNAPNITATGTIPQNTGDLPASVQIIDFGPGGGTDEGEAMLEVIYDVAPGAALAFASSGNTQTSFAANILAMHTAANCTLICDDIGFGDEPFFQDGPIAQAINANFDAGVPHFTASGNEGDLGFLGTYIPFNTSNSTDNGIRPPNGADLHNWGIGGATPHFLPIDIPAFTDIDFSMQWNQPFQSYALGPGSSVDLDLYIYDAPSTSGAILASSENAQFVNGKASNDPLEEVLYSNTSANSKRVYLAVNHHAGVRANTVFRIVYSGLKSSTDSFPLGGAGGMTIYGHSACAKAISVGAISYADIVKNGTEGPDTININAEDFSSKGGIGANGIPFYFDTKGNLLFAHLDKPDIAAPDGVDTSVFATGEDIEPNGFPNFFGSSCAAPNAAAVAALLKERTPLMSPAQLKAALQASARDIVASNPLSGVGPDAFTGAGLIDASAAIALLPRITLQPLSVNVNAGQSVTFSCDASGAQSLVFQWRRDGANIPGATGKQLTLSNAQPGDSVSVFTCFVSNPYGAVSSDGASVGVTIVPAIITQPVSALVNLGTSATFSVVVGPGAVQYQWTRNGINIPGASGATHFTPPTTISDDGAVFQCVITSTFGTLFSDKVNLTVNTPPFLLSAPTASPVYALVGQSVLFSASAQAARGQTVTYNWDFGDGTTGTGASISHAFSQPQIYTVNFSAVDLFGAKSTASLPVYLFQDTDGNGTPDIDPASDNTAFVDMLKQFSRLTPNTLIVSKLSIGLDFTRVGGDSLNMKGVLPLPRDFKPVGRSATLIVGGLGRSFTFDTTGVSTAIPNGVFTLKFDSKRADAQFAKYAIAIKNADLEPYLAASGLQNTNARNQLHAVRATIFFNSAMYDKIQTLFYSARKDRSGKTR